MFRPVLDQGVQWAATLQCLGRAQSVTHEVVTVTTLTSINSQSVCHLLVKLAELSLQVPITLVLDNARYQRCARVQSVANSLGIESLYFVIS